VKFASHQLITDNASLSYRTIGKILFVANVRAEQKEQTRQKLIETTLNLIATEGVSNTTLAKVAKESGISRGIVNFHFNSKEQLMLEALLSVHEKSAKCWQQAYDKGTDNHRKLINLVHALLDNSITNYYESAVWVGFWCEARNRSTYDEVFKEKDQELDKKILQIIKALIREGNYKGISASLVASGLMSLIQGYDLDLLLVPESYNQKQAKQSCFDYLSAYFPKHFQQGKTPSPSN